MSKKTTRTMANPIEIVTADPIMIPIRTAKGVI